jgi:mitochondrial fission protein ELM1
MTDEPIVWLLSGGRKGDLDQMLALAQALGWPHEIKTLRFRGPSHPLFASQRVDKPPAAPWPDLVLCAEAMTSVIARDIKKKSGAHTRIICLGRPAAASQHFDAVLTTAQYRLPAAANVVELQMPLAARPPARANDEGTGPVVLLVGGPAFPDQLDGQVAQDLAREALAHASARGRLLDVHTSPRTPEVAIAMLRQAITPPNRLTVFGQPDNHYRAALSAASEIVVTSDSISMLADALQASPRVSVYPLPQRHGVKLRLGNWLYRKAVLERRTGLTPVRWLFETGMIETAADRRSLIERLVADGRVGWFGAGAARGRPGAAHDDLDTAVRHVRQVMSR